MARKVYDVVSPSGFVQAIGLFGPSFQPVIARKSILNNVLHQCRNTHHELRVCGSPRLAGFKSGAGLGVDAEFFAEFFG
jgi:hypothetical protein